MKANIHPKSQKVVYLDTTSGAMFISETTSNIPKDAEMETVNGEKLPVIKVEISSASHPFYTGKQKASSKGGQIERFLQKVKVAEEKKTTTTTKKKKK